MRPSVTPSAMQLKETEGPRAMRHRCLIKHGVHEIQHSNVKTFKSPLLTAEWCSSVMPPLIKFKRWTNASFIDVFLLGKLCIMCFDFVPLKAKHCLVNMIKAASKVTIAHHDVNDAEKMNAFRIKCKHSGNSCKRRPHHNKFNLKTFFYISRLQVYTQLEMKHSMVCLLCENPNSFIGLIRRRKGESLWQLIRSKPHTHIIHSAKHVGRLSHSGHLNKSHLQPVSQPLSYTGERRRAPHRQALGVTQTQIHAVLWTRQAVSVFWELLKKTKIKESVLARTLFHVKQSLIFNTTKSGNYISL